MKKKTLILFLTISLVPSFVQSQVYIDILTAPAMLANTPLISSEMKKTNNNLNDIQKGQFFLQTQLTLANDLQRKILKGLQEVSGTVRNALTVKQIYETSSDIVSEMQDVINVAKDNPEFTIFAYRSAGIFRERALELYAEVSQILKEEETNLLNAGERQQLLNRVHRDLRLLWGAAYGINHAIKTAIRTGFWRSLNPFKIWVNHDVRIMRDILRNASYLTKRR
ncbi:hypothetical protein [Sphingobacterium siyangense]|uniref:hypothetical protein n=1 Tax=Sphingobacterium siyangense TaxID=459529 RepID=UPI00289B279F|nr:hypothetical protein [Sphingobacterium siyangense]